MKRHASSTQPPDGRPNGCPACGAGVRVVATSLRGETACPVCAARLWFVQFDGLALLFAREEVRDRIHGIIESHSSKRAAPGVSEAFIDDLGADSLDRVELSMVLEDELGYDLGDPKD